MCAFLDAALKAEKKELFATQKSETEIRSLNDSMKVLQEQLGKEHSYLAAEHEVVQTESEINLIFQSAMCRRQRNKLNLLEKS